MSYVPGVEIQVDLEGCCDICNAAMPPSGGTLSARAMKTLVEMGFDPFNIKSDLLSHLASQFEEHGLPLSFFFSHMKAQILQEALGGFGLCPNCFGRVEQYLNETRLKS